MHAVVHMTSRDNNKKCKQYVKVAFQLKNDCRAPLIENLLKMPSIFVACKCLGFLYHFPARNGCIL
jgi:hypothetical protein